MTTVGVVVVAYHGAEDLVRCLSSLGASYPTVVVDNSSDSTVKKVAESAAANYIDQGCNRGFASGVNAGIAHLPFDADVLLLNPDAEIAPDQIELLRSALEADHGLAAVSPLLRTRDGRSQRVGWPFPTPGRMWAEAIGCGRRLERHRGYVVGSVLLLRRQALVDVGAFDESFFLYAEETDWQRRAADRGWRVRISEAAVASHLGAGTSSDATRREALFHAAAETYIRKWYGAAGWASYRAAALAGALLRAVVGAKAKRRAARGRATLYLRGPRRVAGLNR